MQHKFANSLMALAALLAIVAIGFGVYSLTSDQPSKINPQTSYNTTTGNPVLKPATVPSKIAVCEQALSYASNGNPSPLQCNDGALNTLAWNALSAQEPSVMKLGYTPSQTQVEAAICNDANAADLDSSAAISAPLEQSAYTLAALYYGWNFNINVAGVISSC